jgi:DNA-binding MarR family transcriptional regulator
LKKMARARKEKNDPSGANFSLEDYPFYLMTQVMAAYYDMLEKALEAVGVDQPRWRVLMILGAKNPSNMSELCKRSVIKTSTMTRLIQRMQKQGLVRNAPHPDDNRVSEVYLTPMGEERLRMVRDVGGQIFRHAFGAAGNPKLKDFVATLKTLIANLGRSPFELASRVAKPKPARSKSDTRRSTGGR